MDGIVPPLQINDEVYHPLLKEIVLYPPPLHFARGKSKSGSSRFRAKRRKLYAQSDRCFYCKKVLLFEESTLDHKVPKSKGGSNDIENFVLSCKKCNGKKGSSSYEDFLNEQQKSQH